MRHLVSPLNLPLMIPKPKVDPDGLGRDTVGWQFGVEGEQSRVPGGWLGLFTIITSKGHLSGPDPHPCLSVIGDDEEAAPHVRYERDTYLHMVYETCPPQPAPDLACRALFEYGKSVCSPG
jgi:hypothetical protein